jgi:hypothetical protein
MRLATGLLCVGIAIRPDAGIVAACVLGVHVIEEGPMRARSWIPVAVFAGVVLSLTAFRLVYYGSPVPNTFYAKVGGIPLSMSLGAARGFLLEAPICLLIPAALSIRGRLRTVAPGAACVGTMLYVVGSGGTAMTFSRFLGPLLPILAALAARTAARALDRGDRLGPLWLCCLVATAAGYLGGPFALLAALAAGAALSAVFPISQLSTRRAAVVIAAAGALAATGVAVSSEHVSRFERVSRNREFDRMLLEGTTARLQKLRQGGLPPGSVVGAIAIGVLGYYGEYPVLDLLGLADPVIARSSDRVRGPVALGQGHVRSNASYVLGRRPAVLLIARNPGPNTPALTAVRALWEHPELERLYRWDPRLGAYRLRFGRDQG